MYNYLTKKKKWLCYHGMSLLHLQKERVLHGVGHVSRVAKNGQTTTQSPE